MRRAAALRGQDGFLLGHGHRQQHQEQHQEQYQEQHLRQHLRQHQPQQPEHRDHRSGSRDASPSPSWGGPSLQGPLGGDGYGGGCSVVERSLLGAPRRLGLGRCLGAAGEAGEPLPTQMPWFKAPPVPRPSHGDDAGTGRGAGRPPRPDYSQLHHSTEGGTRFVPVEAPVPAPLEPPPQQQRTSAAPVATEPRPGSLDAQRGSSPLFEQRLAAARAAAAVRSGADAATAPATDAHPQLPPPPPPPPAGNLAAAPEPFSFVPPSPVPGGSLSDALVAEGAAMGSATMGSATIGSTTAGAGEPVALSLCGPGLSLDDLAGLDLYAGVA